MNSGIGQIKSNRKSKSQHQNHGISNENEKYSLKCTISSLRLELIPLKLKAEGSKFNLSN